MDILGWIWLAVTSLLGLVWSVAWFLLGGWVVTLVQVVVIVGLVFVYKYGWARAPVELAQRLTGISRFVWAWARAREVPPPAPRGEPSRRISHRRERMPGDVNLSTLLSLVALFGLGLVSAL